MGAEKEIKITRFDGGIGDERRDLPDGYFWYMENLEVGDQYRSVKQVPNVTDTVNDFGIKSLLVVNNTVYGLGWDNSGNKDVTLYSADVSTSSTPSFSVVTNGTISGRDLSANERPFLEYKDSIVTFSSNDRVHYYNTGTNVMSTGDTIASGGMKGGCIWQSSGWGWIGQIIQQVNLANGTVTAKITIPSDQYIMDVVPWGNYLLIVCTAALDSAAAVAAGVPSKMYVWDGVTTTTFTDIVEIGYGRVMGADNLDGQLCAVIGFPNQKGFRIKQWSGNSFKTLVTYTGKRNDANSLKQAIPSSFVKTYTGYLYFLAQITRPGSSSASPSLEMVIFRYGKKDETRKNALSVYKTLEITPQSTFNFSKNDFVISEWGTTGSDLPENHLIATVSEASNTYRITLTSKSGSAPSYAAQAGVFETTLFTGGDSSKQKQLKSIAVQFAPLSASGQVVLKYKKDEDSSWTTIFTETTDNAISHEAVNIESTDAVLPTFKEITFRVETLGAVEVTGLKGKYEEIENVYGN